VFGIETILDTTCRRTCVTVDAASAAVTDKKYNLNNSYRSFKDCLFNIAIISEQARRLLISVKLAPSL